jgi:predicted amidophosphoribosyltransferase
MRLRDAPAHAIGLLAPPACCVCGTGCAPAQVLCPDCRVRIRSGPPGRTVLAGVGPVGWAAPYDGTARRALTALKFGGRVRLAAPLAEAIAAACAELAGRRVVVPVPAAGRRLRRRGFDPAALLASALGAELGLPRSACLRRRDGRRQVGRTRAERIASPPSVGARHAAPPRALLVDDVITTGATLAACAAALRDAGCASVAAVTFARSLGETTRPA